MPSSTLKAEVDAVRAEFGAVASRLSLIHDGLQANLDNPDADSIRGAASFLRDTLNLLSEATSTLWEDTHLANYLNSAGEDVPA